MTTLSTDALPPQSAAPAGLIGGSWRHLSDQIGRAMCAVRAINDLRHRTQIVFPGHHTQGKGRAAVTLGEDEELIRLPVHDQPVAARPGKSAPAPAQQMVLLLSRACDPDWCPRDDYHTLPTVLLFYSAEMHLAAMMPYVRLLRRQGLNVAMPEYIGYGLSSGDPSERGCLASAQASLEYLLDRPDVDASRMIFMGCGLGAAMATELASRYEAAGLICISPFTSLLDLLRWRLPQRTLDVLVRQKFDTAERMKLVRCPIAIAHAADDQIIPAEMTERLMLSTRSICRKILVPGSKLHGAELLADEHAVLQPLVQFIRESRPRLISSEQRRAAVVTTRPLAIRQAAAPTDAPDIHPAYSAETAPGWRGSSPSRIVPVRYPKPVSRAC
jgi:pimeloyl-ACP methyl ester carboxylesterase